MDQATGWRPSERARWLGWTVLFGLLLAGAMVPILHHVPDIGGFLVLACFVLSLVAAFAIGVRFPSPRWAAGPPAAVLATVLAALALPESGPATPGPMGNMTQKDGFVFFLVWGGWILLILLALVYGALAAAGVKVGQRRHAAAEPLAAGPEDNAAA